VFSQVEHVKVPRSRCPGVLSGSRVAPEANAEVQPANHLAAADSLL
jgi:hypothetical protein